MTTNELIKKLDEAFFKTKVIEDHTAWSMTEETIKFTNTDFLNKSTGLMLNFSQDIENVFTTVFVTDEVVDEVCKTNNSLLFTHHHFDYYEDKRGLVPISIDKVQRLKNANIALYVAHAGLDTHKEYGTSKSLAEALDIEIESYFFDYFGSPTALVGKVPKQNSDEFIKKCKIKLERKELTLEIYKEYIEKVAIVAGGGDEAEILQQAYDFGCDTFIGGTVENKWGLPFIQENNKEFRELNKALKLNLIGGTHYGTERFAMIKVVDYFRKLGFSAEFIEDEKLLNAE